MNEWLLDSGCTFHMTPFKEILTNYKSDNSGSVSMANEKLCDVKGFGDVCLTFESGFKLTLKNVRHVPDLCHNLISCAALEEEGLEGRWGKGIMKIMKGSLTVFKAEKRRNLYVCHVKYDLLAASVLNKNDSNLWHKRLGHISMKGLELLHKHGILSGSINEIDFCDDCILGKQHKVHFPSSSPNPVSSSCVLDYVHADNNDKLEPRAQKCVFIGYPEGVKGYRLWLRNQTGFKVVISKDVTFNESEMPCLNNSSRTELDFPSMFNKVEGSKEDNQQGEEDSEETQPESENTRIETQNDISSENIPSTHNYQLARDRDRRESRLPSRFRDFHLALNTESNEPSSYREALESSDAKNWKNAMNDEIISLLKNKTWILVPKPENVSIVDCLPHWEALKWLLRYLNGSVSAGIKFSKHTDGVSLVGYVDSNYANDRDSRRSTTSKRIINLEKINSDNNPADMGSIALGPESFGNDEAHFRPLWIWSKVEHVEILAQILTGPEAQFTGWRTLDLSPLDHPHHPRPATRLCGLPVWCLPLWLGLESCNRELGFAGLFACVALGSVKSGTGYLSLCHT
ncbi:UNVERIFIED_CONTAM: Retrovirus-related Pol polyprotein from transposon TNT 1-94 [Sesamum calycinum]|uniref:Retrovirus-related Pol polyprotein from transposon TNT 1-94 n=1 Tax=Sesamum calycinum TaxID=2727403 RepID=A0AAW2PQT1_9LAMI